MKAPEVISDEKLRQQFLHVKRLLMSGQYDGTGVCIVFVYNSLQDSNIDEAHKSECIYSDEIALIKDAFYSVPKAKVNLIDGEEKFAIAAMQLRKDYNNVFVYSMAQNICGAGRRCFIPLLCEYYGFINISSNSRSSFLGGDKKLMNALLANKIFMPNRLFLSKPSNEKVIAFKNKHHDILIKPNSESASIGVQKINDDVGTTNLQNAVVEALTTYQNVFLEEFIDGDEVECMVVPWYNSLYVSTPIKIIKEGEYLDYDAVANDAYSFEPYQNSMTDAIRSQALQAYQLLEFDSLARFDFIVKGNKTYLFDITPNPTVSHCSSVNTALKFLDNDDRAIYQLLLFQKLFKPPFN